MFSLFDDGSVSVEFKDDVDGPSFFHMSPSGSCFVVENKSGVVVKQQTHLASSKFRPMVMRTLALRNQYTHFAPFLRYDMLEPKLQEEVQKFPCKLEFARWLKRPIVRESEDGSRHLESIENLVTLRLWPCKVLVDVTYPAHVLSDGSGIGRFGYLKMKQTFIVSQAPSIWHDMIQVLLHYENEPVLDSDITLIPGTNQNISPADTINALFCPSLVDNHKKLVRLIVDNNWIYWSHKLNDSPEMMALNLTTQAMVESFRQFHFVRLRSLNECLDQTDGHVFSIANFLNADGDIPSKYEFLKDIIRRGHALAVQNSYASAQTESIKRCKKNIFSSAVKEKVIQDTIGEFVAFEDGRVRVTFDDRVILELSSNHQTARILTRNGDFIDIRIDCPAGYKQHVQYALDFARWAFSGTEERQYQMAAKDRARKALKLSALANQLYLKKLDNFNNQ